MLLIVVYQISAFATLDDLTQLAVGFANGIVTVIRGDLIHDRGTRQRVVLESQEPVTGIEFREGNTTALYIATSARILTLILSGRGQGQPSRTLDDLGCAVGCMTADRTTRDVIVARDDAIYYYGLHGRVACYSCDGHKTLLKSYNDYIVLAYPSSSSSISHTTLASFANGQGADLERHDTLTILNTDFTFIAHTENLGSSIQHCFSVWGDLFVVTTKGKILSYHEKTLQQRLDLLMQRNLFVLAIQVAQKAGVDSTKQNMIFRKHGDYLYQRKDYDTAMQQYLRAIDSAEPSQIIRKVRHALSREYLDPPLTSNQYLGTQRIHNLIDYLEELHETGKATADHTVLLLNCYAKTKDIDKLEAFIKSPNKEIQFDLDTAISMCRQGGYFDQAAYLARKHSEHDIVVSVLIEDLHKYAEALEYIWRLEPPLAYTNMTKYATVLLSHCPEDTTSLLISYYTGRFRPKKDAIDVTTTNENSSTTSSTTQQTAKLATTAVQIPAALLPLPYMPLSSRSDLPTPKDKSQIHVVESAPSKDEEDTPPSYAVPAPRTAFSSFVGHPSQFITFLEACISSPTLSATDKSEIYTTLFEMYLRAANSTSPAPSPSEKATWEAKAKNLVEDEHVFLEPSNVLLLSDLSHFETGTTLVREQQGLQFDIFRAYTSAGDTTGAIRALNKYGEQEKGLYPAALAYFVSSEKVLEEAGEEFGRVLRKCEREGLMSPLQIVQTLAKNEVASVGMIKHFLGDVVEKEKGQVENVSFTVLLFAISPFRKVIPLEVPFQR